MWILDYAERETAFEKQFVQRNETNVTTNDNTVLFYFKFLEGNLISLTNRSFPHLLFFVLSDRLLQMVTQVISLTLRNLYYTWPTNTNPLRRVSWRPLGVLYLTDMLNAFFSRPAHDLTFFEGALEPCRKGEMSILFNGGVHLDLGSKWTVSLGNSAMCGCQELHMATMSRRRVVF